jgi:hypothetical protein
MNDVAKHIDFGDANIDNRHPTYYENSAWLTHNKRKDITADDLATVHRAMTVSLPPMAADSDLLLNAHDQNFLYNVEWAYDTCFDLISETGGFSLTNTPVVSEKFFKSVYFKRPFMINGDAGSLRLIKKFGFNTFRNLFDESYDDYPNLFDRQSCIIDNIRRVMNDNAALMQSIRSCRDNLEYNYDLLMGVGKLEGIVARMLDEELSQ